jgi:two-component system, chemotaxis family, response regulator Rcp1
MYRNAGIVRPLEILLVEDNPADVVLVREGLKATTMKHHLHTVVDGEEASHFIRRQDRFEGAPRPDLILLDLNLPRRSGHEVLSEIKADPGTRRIPVLVLTSSKDRTDVEKVYDLNANCYIQKPIDLDGMFEMLRVVESFWLQWAVLPVPA